MPFQSEAQRKFMFAKHPRIAHRWAHEYGTPKDLPEHKKKTEKEGAARWRDPKVVEALRRRLRLPGFSDLADVARRLRNPPEVSRLESSITRAQPGMVSSLDDWLRNAPPGGIPTPAQIRGPLTAYSASTKADLLGQNYRRTLSRHPALPMLKDVSQDIGAYAHGQAPAELRRARDAMVQELRNVPRPTELGPQKTAAHGTKEGFMTLEEKVIDAFQMCNAVIGQAEKVQQEKRAADEAAAAQIPGVVEVLAQRGLIDQDEKEAAARALRDPAQVLTLLKRAAVYVTEAQAGRPLGEQVDANGRSAGGTVKRASHVMGSVDSPYVGVRTSEPKPSDLALLRGLGLG